MVVMPFLTLFHPSTRNVRIPCSIAFCAIVEDDGEGFGAGDVSDGFGLLGMRERAALAGGHVLIETERDRGTTVRLEVPLG